MKQYDLDALGMRITRICSYMSETACLTRVLAEISDESCGYFIKESDPSTLSNIVVKYIGRVHRDIIRLKNDFEFPVSSRHRL